MADKIKLRNGTASAWTSADPTLLVGEIGLETDTRRRKTGDGSTAWTSLPYDNYPKVATKSADYTILDADSDVFEVTTAATNRTLTLPTLADNQGRVIEIHKVDAGAGKGIIDGEGAETIDGETTIDLDSQHDYCRLRAGAAGWHLIEYKDHGANNNTWERHADGTLVQTDTPAAIGGETITFDVPYDTTAPVISSAMLRTAGQATSGYTVTALSITAFTYTTAATAQHMWIARGRWRA